MMRRGPLDRYPVEWVLREAQAHEVTGSIELHVEAPITIFLDAGKVYAAAEGIGVDAADDAASSASLPELEARKRAVALLSRALSAPSPGGWYYHDPFGHLPTIGSWTWELAALLMETRARSHEGQTLGPWAERTLGLRATGGSGISLGPDAWSLVVALAGTAVASDLRARLGWSPARMLAALTEVEQMGVLDPAAAWRPDPGDPGDRTATPLPDPTVGPSSADPGGAPILRPVGDRTAGASATASGRHPGPLPPPPVLPASGAGRARRSRRPARRPGTT
jgi:hypothetical protein